MGYPIPSAAMTEPKRPQRGPTSESGPISWIEMREEDAKAAGGVRVMHLQGEMDHNTLPRIQEFFTRALEQGTQRAALVMERVRFMNSTAVSAVLDFHLKLQEAGGACVLVAPSENVKLVLDTLGFTETVLTVVDTVEAARKALEQ